jgi:tetratricopeptide (TPR) repeat protein
VGINLAKSLQFVGPKEQFSNFESYVHQNLPNDPNALMNLGLRYLQMGRYDKAEDFLKQVLAVDQGDFAAEVYLGESYEGQKDHAKAAQAYMAALRLSPQSPTAATGYVEALYQSPNYLDAARFCSAWVYPEGSSGVISGLKTQDLFFLCAEAERGSGDTSKDRLQWYYVQSLIHPEAEQPDVMVAIADSKTLVTMHDLLCSLKGEPIRPDHDRKQWLDATAALEDSLVKRSTLEPAMQPLATDCKRAAERLEPSAPTLKSAYRNR